MGTVFRCILVILGVTLWLMFSISSVEGSLSSRRSGGGVIRRPTQVNRWYLVEGVSETPYSECDPDTAVGKVTRVEVVGCDSDPCQLKAGGSATFNLGFIANVNATEVKTVVHGVIGVVPVPFHVPQPDACTGCGIKCPLIAGKEYHYSTSIPVLKNYPRIGVKVKWELITEDGKDLVCVLIPAKIVS